MQPYIAISLGWGVQSWTLAAMSALGELPPVDVAIHADTTHERSSTYAFAEQWTPWLEAHGVRVVTVVNPDQAARVTTFATDIPAYTERDVPEYHYTDDDERRLATGRTVRAQGRLKRQCTGRWKIGPQRAWLQANRNGHPVEQWFGITTDEWHRAKDSDVKYITHRYPLLDMGMSRADCLRWLRNHDLPTPGKSACVFCPFHSRLAWEQMKREGGDDWQRAVEVDAAIRDARPGYKTYVNRKCIPLDQAVRIPEDDGFSQLELLASDDQDAECDSGYCFL